MLVTSANPLKCIVERWYREHLSTAQCQHSVKSCLLLNLYSNSYNVAVIFTSSSHLDVSTESHTQAATTSGIRKTIPFVI